MSTLTRRNFLHLTGAAAVATALGTPDIAHAANPYGKLRMGIQSYSLRGFGFDEAMQKINELGLKYVELFPGHFSHEAPAAERKEKQKKLADLGIQPDCYGVIKFTTDEAAARKIFDFGKELGMASLSASPEKDSFDLLDKLVEEYQIPIAIHNHGPHDKKWGRPVQIHDAVKDHHPLIGVCADTGHFLRAGIDPIKAIQLLEGRVFGLHVKDFVGEEEEVIAGDGNLDLIALVMELYRQNFKGTCSVEYELDKDDPMAGIRKGLENVQKAVKAQDK